MKYFLILLALTGIAFATDEFAPTGIVVPGISNAFRAAPDLLSGSAPKGDAAFETLARMGVKTIISVDGSRPDVEAAKRHGLRYIHLPVGYDGIPASRITELVKAAGDKDGQVFVHCHHGKHRGPAAVGVIGEALCGWTPNQAEKWMRTAGTAVDYVGLYRSVREFTAPTNAQIAAVGILPSVAKTEDFVESMVKVDNLFDRIKASNQLRWATPDADMEAVILLHEEFRELVRLPLHAGSKNDAQEFRALLAKSEESVAKIREMVTIRPIDSAKLDLAIKTVEEACNSCHKSHRNGK